MKRSITIAIIIAISVVMLSSCSNSNETGDEYKTGLIAGNFVYSQSMNDKSIKIDLYNGEESNVIIPDSLDGHPVVNIGEGAFANNSNIVSVSLPKKVNTISKDAFNSCSSLVSIDLKNVEFIKDYAFSKCTSLKDVTFSKNLTEIGDGAFWQCASLKQCEFGNKLNKVGNEAFIGTPWFFSQKDEFVLVGDDLLIGYNGTSPDVSIPNNVKYISSAFSGNNTIESVSIPKSVTKIYACAFQDCINLQKVEMTDNVTEIGSCAFCRCSHLKDITLSDSIKTISSQAFMMCTSINNIVVPNSVESIEFEAFYGCKTLVSITLPKSLQLICDGAFDECTNLVNVHFLGKESSWKRMSIEQNNKKLNDAIMKYK